MRTCILTYVKIFSFVNSYICLMKSYLASCFLIILASFHLSAQDDYIFNKITTHDGLSHSTVYAITQDEKGFIWFGTREGLNKYNSYELKSYYTNPKDSLGLNSNEITSLLAVDSGHLFIGTTKGLNYYNYELDKITNLKYNGKDVGVINAMYQSSGGAVYICANTGLYEKSPGNQIKQLINSVNVISIQEFKKNVFWMATLRGVFLINEYGEIIKSYYQLNKSDHERLSTENNISCIFKDSDGEIWIGTIKNGLYHYIEEKDVFEPIIPIHKNNPIEVNVIRTVAEDHKNNLWIGTESGLFIFDKKTKKFSHHTQSFDNSSYTLNDKAIYSIFRSRENIMWMGTYFGGVNYVKPREIGFYKMMPDGGKNALSGKAVSQIIEDKKGKLWIATEDGGISIYDRKAQSFSYLKHHPGKQNSLSVNNVHALHDDGNGNIWIGTFLGGLNKYDLSTHKVTVYKHVPNDPTSLSNNYVYSLLTDSSGRLWVGTQNGLNIFLKNEGRFKHFKPNYFQGKFIYDILEDDKNNIWFCTRDNGLFYYNPHNDNITWYSSSSTLPSNNIISAYQDDQKRIWFGTLNGGLMKYDRKRYAFTSYTMKDGLPNNNVYGILEDNSDNLWLSTNKGLSKMNISSEEFTNFNISHGLTNNQFNFKSFHKTSDGWMYFGTVNGLCYFHPDSLNFNTAPPAVQFSDLKLFSKSVDVSDHSILEKNIDETDNITLKYKQNVISFEFIAINYFSPGNNLFTYYLEGFEDKWNNPGTKNTATYTNLSPGHYTFKVKVANNNGVWTKEPRTIDLEILPPLWLSTWAFLFYGILIIAALMLYRKFLQYRHEQKMALKVERIEKEKIHEINQQKLNFFTYISHEFKTPLTLIIASIDRYINHGYHRENVQVRDFKLIKRYASRLHFLIDQLMDFRRIETSHGNLDLSRGDIITFLRDTFSAFIPLFSKKNIHYQTSSNIEEHITYFDADKLEKILTNILSNAIKNTKTFGEISMEIEIDRKNQKIHITLLDTGIGLMEGESDKVFIPFYQSKSDKVKTTGSGIGLALVHSLIKYLKGDINIVSTVEEGTKIKITLPIHDHLDAEPELMKSIEGNKSLSIDHELFDEEDWNDEEDDHQEEAESDFELMIVEDNNDLLKFLTNHFSGYYKISYARDGKSALEKIKHSLPDIIISDVIMPKIDGITLCKRLKSTLSTSHIPVILLTAKSTVHNKIEGLDVGADAYLPKPFNLKELELLIKNILDSRNNLKKHFLTFGNVENHEVPINNKDQDFLRKLTETVHAHLDDPDFNITTFTKEVGISRTLLHLKIKKLVNLSTSEFVRTIRLQKAAQLLKESDISVSVVAYKVGFSDPNYFSRSFKEKYNKTPSEYKAT